MRRNRHADLATILLREKNLVMLNMLRDIVENEASVADVVVDGSDDVIESAIRIRAIRRREILAEIDDFLFREEAGIPVKAI